jgi:mRNA interferase MazF
VLSPRLYNERVGMAILCPITSKIKGYPFEVQIPQGLGIEGVILSDQVKNLDWQVREAEFQSRLTESVLEEVLQKLATLLGN